MRIADGLEMLEVQGFAPSYPVLVWDDDGAVLIDTSFPPNLEALIEAISNAGVNPQSLTTLIFTHQDMDHIGCAKDLIARFPNIKTAAHELEAPYIQGDKTPYKIEKREKAATTQEQKQEIEEQKAAYAEKVVPIQTLLKDGDVLPLCGGIQVIHTPGHTPGHICLYLQRDEVLVVGDALNIADNKLAGPNPVYTADMDLAYKSIEKLREFAAKKVLCFHGGAHDGPVLDIVSL